MKISTIDEKVFETSCDLLGLACFEKRIGEVEAFREIDRILDGLLSKLVDEEAFIGEKDKSLLVHTLGRLPCQRVAIVGLGKRERFELPDIRHYGASLVTIAKHHGSKKVATVLPPVDAVAQDRAVQFLAEGLYLGRYQFDRFISEEKRRPDKLDKVEVLLEKHSEMKSTVSIQLAKAEVVATAICTARDLVNEPSVCKTPHFLANFAQTLAKNGCFECKVLGPEECEKQQMNLFLAVAKGSINEPRFIHLTYKPKGNNTQKRRYALIGKGVTFDSGGLTLKSAANLVDMKSDMAGAACVLATMSALPLLGVQAEIHAVIPATENMISGSAYKVGDIYTAANGKSVEITNTDAEGRLTLADALIYACRLSPDEIIDVATLTGACMVALGAHTAGIMGNDRALVEHFSAAARTAGEDVWALPLPMRLKEQLKSPIADLKNSGDRWGGALTAGLFLQEFVEQVPWIHVDIAGPAFAEKAYGHISKGGTGFGVATLLEYLTTRENIR
ncbi:MAG: leucyl aminopeptidase [Pseudomonadota bacterium]